jgi:RNA polymerase sigma-70 factor, ECF subfamily
MNAAAAPDAQLIEQTLRGNAAAFGYLVRKYQQRLHEAMLRVDGRHGEAEDVVQEAFLQAFLHLRTFRGSSAFYTWLYRIAYNVACRFRKVRQRAACADRSWNDLRGYPGNVDYGVRVKNEPDPRCRFLRQAMAQLEAGYRTVLILREVEGHSYERIAEMLGLPTGTVRSRLYRARLHLLKMLQPHLFVEG